MIWEQSFSHLRIRYTNFRSVGLSQVWLESTYSQPSKPRECCKTDHKFLFPCLAVHGQDGRRPIQDDDLDAVVVLLIRKLVRLRQEPPNLAEVTNSWTAFEKNEFYFFKVMPAAFSVENKRCVSFFNVGEKPTRDSEMNVSRDSESMKTIHSFISQKVDHNWSSSADL